MRYLLIIIGFLLLVGGYQLPWLFVGGTAFALTHYIATHFQLIQNEYSLILISLTAGIIGVMLYYYFGRIPVIIASFFAGGFISYYFPVIFMWSAGGFSILAFIIVGIIASALTFFWYSFALIIVTSFAGSLLILQNFKFGNIPSQTMFIVLVFVGLVAQFVMMQYSPPETG